MGSAHFNEEELKDIGRSLAHSVLVFKKWWTSLKFTPLWRPAPSFSHVDDDSYSFFDDDH